MGVEYPEGADLKRSQVMQADDGRDVLGAENGDDAATVRAPSGAEVAEIAHADGVLTRLSSDAVVSRQPGRVPADQPVSLRLHLGSSWHRLWSALGRHGIEVQTPSALASATDGAFSVVCEPIGSVFVVALEGTVTVIAGGESTVLQPLQAMDVGLDGRPGEVIDVTPDEINSDRWIALNLELEAARAATAPSSWSELPPLVGDRAEAETEAQTETEAQSQSQAEAETEAPAAEAPPEPDLLAEPSIAS